MPSKIRWQRAWREGRTPFHRSRVGEELTEETWLEDRPQRVFVPLCGKTKDMLWLVEQGHETVGVEFVEEAVRDFYREHGLSPEIREDGAFRVFETERLRILVGDFFDLQASELGTFDAIYDRAAIVAIEEELRPPYAALLMELLRPGGKMFISSCVYDRNRMNGPPYSVAEEEIRSLFGDDCDISILKRGDLIDLRPDFRAQGLEELIITRYLCIRGS